MKKEKREKIKLQDIVTTISQTMITRKNKANQNKTTAKIQTIVFWDNNKKSNIINVMIL